MPMATQAKLLKGLEEMTFRRLGGTRDLSVSVRIVAATNKDLAEEVQRGTFRLDLYHRLDVFHIRLPPLRDRREDILPLAEHFLTAADGEKIIIWHVPAKLGHPVVMYFPGNGDFLAGLVGGEVAAD